MQWPFMQICLIEVMEFLKIKKNTFDIIECQLKKEMHMECTIIEISELESIPLSY